MMVSQFQAQETRMKFLNENTFKVNRTEKDGTQDESEKEKKPESLENSTEQGLFGRLIVAQIF